MLYLYRRKVSRGQGSIGYMFMIAMGLLFILIAFAFIIEDSGTSREAAMEHAENSSIKSQAVVSKSNLENFGLWNDDFTASLKSNHIIEVYKEGELVYAVHYENSTYREDVSRWSTANGLSFGEIYVKCIDGDLNACKFIIALQQGIWERE